MKAHKVEISQEESIQLYNLHFTEEQGCGDLRKRAGTSLLEETD